MVLVFFVYIGSMVFEGCFFVARDGVFMFFFYVFNVALSCVILFILFVNGFGVCVFWIVFF